MAITLNANAFLSSLTNLIAYTFVVPQFKDGGTSIQVTCISHVSKWKLNL